jgi:hypothetical protein
MTMGNRLEGSGTAPGLWRTVRRTIKRNRAAMALLPPAMRRGCQSSTLMNKPLVLQRTAQHKIVPGPSKALRRFFIKAHDTGFPIAGEAPAQRKIYDFFLKTLEKQIEV